jgi:TetR/AcrR family transcriptional repressor of lmrAB and yxaGH operons
MSELPTRQRMIETAVRLFQRNGYQATSWRTLVDEAGTPWGSAHHHFPGGKEQLGVAAIELASRSVIARMAKLFAETRKPAEAVRAWCRASADELEQSGFVCGCPIATVALEAVPASAALTAACKAAFDRWQELLAEGLMSYGVKRKRAAQLATLVLVNIEGGYLVSRVSRSKTPMLLAGEQLAELLEAETAS